MAGRTLIAGACAAVLAAATLASGDAGAEDRVLGLGASPGTTPRASLPNAFSRVVSARVRHTRLRPVRKSNARRIGRSLASLRPTWVTGTLRYARNQYPKRDELRAWNEIRRIVRHHSPGAHFDVVLNAEQYRTPLAIRRTMGRLRAKLHPEGWFFDFLTTGYRRHPSMLRAAIDSAHAHGEWIGGNIFGVGSGRRLPGRVDFWSVQDHVFHLNLPAVGKLAARKPILYHLNSNPQHRRSGGCRFIQRLSTKQRVKLIRRRASQQAHYGFRFSYPALFPQCLRNRPNGPGTFLYAYNAFRDPRVAEEIRTQLDRNDFDPST